MGMFKHFDPNSGMGRGNRLGHMMYADTPPTHAASMDAVDPLARVLSSGQDREPLLGHKRRPSHTQRPQSAGVWPIPAARATETLSTPCKLTVEPAVGADVH